MVILLTDENIQEILKSLVDCLTEKNISRLENRFIFVEYSSTIDNIDVLLYAKEIGGKIIPMTKIILKDFEILYDLLLEKKPTLPVRILRRLKDELYSYTITSKPTSNLRLAFIDDERIKDNDYAIAIGKVCEISEMGLTGVGSIEWYKNAYRTK